MESAAPRVMPAIVLRSIGIGLLMMAFFTAIWNGIAYGFRGSVEGAIPFIVFVAVFLFYGIRFLVLSRSFPKLSTEEDKARGKKMGTSFGIIFGIEGTLIPIVCGLLAALKADAYILPAIAMIVGLHFYPMGVVFGRRIDYYLATWTCFCAGFAIYSVATGPAGHYAATIAMLGYNVSIATSLYGFYMIRQGVIIVRSRVHHGPPLPTHGR